MWMMFLTVWQARNSYHQRMQLRILEFNCQNHFLGFDCIENQAEDIFNDNHTAYFYEFPND